VYVRELVATYRIRPGWVTRDSLAIDAPRAAAAIFSQILGEEAVEVCGLLCLNTKLRVLAYHEVHRGGVSAVVVHVRDVFKAALLANSSTVVVGHNHPSGDPTPSQDDQELTRRLASAGTLLGVHVLDHVIVGHGGRFFSFKETGGL
jgi:DNA repair protein RadC